MKFDDEYARDAFSYKCQHGFDCYEEKYAFNVKRLQVITNTNKKFMIYYKLNLESKTHKRFKIVIDSEHDGQLKFFTNRKSKGLWIFYHTSEDPTHPSSQLCTKDAVNDVLRRLTSPEGFAHFEDVVNILDIGNLFFAEH